MICMKLSQSIEDRTDGRRPPLSLVCSLVEVPAGSLKDIFHVFLEAGGVFELIGEGALVRRKGAFASGGGGEYLVVMGLWNEHDQPS